MKNSINLDENNSDLNSEVNDLQNSIVKSKEVHYREELFELIANDSNINDKKIKKIISNLFINEEIDENKLISVLRNNENRL
jgi:hypothetical protein